jgi:hypothetical protein
MAAAGQTYPAVYIAAKVNNIFGVYYVTGDMRVFGRVYLDGMASSTIVGNPQ